MRRVKSNNIIKSVDFPERQFKSKSELFKCLFDNQKEIINIKKSQIYKSHDKRRLPFNSLDVSKMSALKSFQAKDNFIYPIISTTNYMDSHKDVHFRGSMTKTAKEQNGKVKYILDHELKYDSVLAWEKDVNMFVSEIPWGMVGKSYIGTTEALIFEINKDNIRKKEVLSDIENKVSDFENSIRMVYFKINLGLDSDDKEYKENKKYFDDRIDLIANKEEALKDGYFWGVEELGIWKEGSLVVAGGSNDATSIFEPSGDTQSIINESQKSTRRR